jgi:hypothetical protein
MISGIRRASPIIGVKIAAPIVHIGVAQEHKQIGEAQETIHSASPIVTELACKLGSTGRKQKYRK